MVSIRYGPHVVGRYSGEGKPVRGQSAQPTESRGKGGTVEAVENQKPVSHRSHRPLEIPQKRRDSHFSTAPIAGGVNEKKKPRKPPSASRRGTAGQTN
jgi:hypothetical protein